MIWKDWLIIGLIALVILLVLGAFGSYQNCAEAIFEVYAKCNEHGCVLK